MTLGCGDDKLSLKDMHFIQGIIAGNLKQLIVFVIDWENGSELGYHFGTKYFAGMHWKAPYCMCSFGHGTASESNLT